MGNVEGVYIDRLHSSKNLRVASLEQSDFKRFASWLKSANFLAGIIYCWVIEWIFTFTYLILYSYVPFHFFV